MMERLSPFYPAVLVFLGALFVAAGGFWASWRQSNFNIELNKKNEEIARLQQDNVNTMTGGDSLSYAGFQIFGPDGSVVKAYRAMFHLTFPSTIPMFSMVREIGHAIRPFGR